MSKIPFLILLILFPYIVAAQVGITVNSSKLYYKAGIGGSETQTIVVSNPNDSELEVGLSFEDWKYDSLGNNQFFESNTLEISCTNWITIQPASYFVLKPYETKNIEVVMNVPENVDTNIKVHTGLLYFTQLNPADGQDASGASLKVTVRLGVKIYHAFPDKNKKMMEITDFRKLIAETETETTLQLMVENTGESWIDGKVDMEVINKTTGEITKIPTFEFYSLPNDQTYLRTLLPDHLQKGAYTAIAIINYGNQAEIKMAELEFEL